MAQPHFKVSPQVLGPLGVEQLHDPALAVLELVKNSWDADATRVSIHIDQRNSEGKIAVIDDGHGMTRDDFENRWLVIGSSHKRMRAKSPKGRPLIGEKGLGRLASFALGRRLSISSAPPNGPGFRADIDWVALSSARSIEDYAVDVVSIRQSRGTRVELSDLKAIWQPEHTQFLVAHAEFLASVPGERFKISLRVNGTRQALDDPLKTLSRFAEASFEMVILDDGTPRVTSCEVNGVKQTKAAFRGFPRLQKDESLSGVRVWLKFFRRDEAGKRLSSALQRNEVKEVLERYQGIRVYRDGLNVPPYGLNKDDWARLEKQRTSTGGPTMVPGNSQLIGEVHLAREKHPQFVVTAGRSGFSDQSALGSLANYVRWAVRELGTARRAEQLGLKPGTEIPARVDAERHSEGNPQTDAALALARLGRSEHVLKDPELRQSVVEAVKVVAEAFDRSDETLRLYAQLASTGIAATSFVHELRTDFDVISEAVAQLKRGSRDTSAEVVALLNESWSRIRSFAALFKIVPVKVRRQRTTMKRASVETSARSILGLAPPDKVTSTVEVEPVSLKLVPAELDSILLNLVSNAVKAINESEERETGKIRIRIMQRGTDAVVSVTDNGIGVSADVRPVMFEPLEGKFAEGTGMGLPIVKFIAERYKGRVSLSASPPKGFSTEFVVVLKDVAPL